MTVEELKSKYTSIQRMKKGGQKVVYRAVSSTGDIVALKIINNATDSRVLQEVALVKQLTLPCVPRILESGIAKDESVNEDVLYIIEQYIDGTSLRDWINSNNIADLKKSYLTKVELNKICIYAIIFAAFC